MNDTRRYDILHASEKKTTRQPRVDIAVPICAKAFSNPLALWSLPTIQRGEGEGGGDNRFTAPRTRQGIYQLCPLAGTLLTCPLLYWPQMGCTIIATTAWGRGSKLFTFNLRGRTWTVPSQIPRSFCNSRRTSTDDGRLYALASVAGADKTHGALFPAAEPFPRKRERLLYVRFAMYCSAGAFEGDITKGGGLLSSSTSKASRKKRASQ